MSTTDQAEPDLLTKEALASLDIKKQPFDKTADHFKLYTDDAIQDLMKQIQNILGNSDHLPVIFGAVGAGKTSLLNLLINSTNDAVQYFVVEGNELFNAYNVFAGMLEAFQIPAPEDLQACLDELAIQLRALEEQKLQAVILIDDAHSVNPSELYKLISGMLYMRDGSDLKSFRIALTAKPEFEERLSKIIPAGTELHYTTLPLPKLDGEKTGLFIAHHLKQAGFFEPLPLDSTQIQSIRRTANGLPGNTCNVAIQTLNQLYEAQTTDTKRSKPSSLRISLFNDKRLLGVIAGAFILFSLFLFTSQKPEQPVTETSPSPDVVVTSEPLELDNDETTVIEIENNNGTPRLVLLSELETSKPAINKETSDKISTEAPKSQQAASLEPEPRVEPVAEPKESTPIKPEPLPATEEIQEEIVEPTAAKPAAVEEKPTAPEQSELVKQQEVTPVEVVAEPESTGDEQSESANGSLQSPNWVLMQDPLRFTVQVIASSDRKEVERFLAIHQLSGPNSIFSFKRGEETWYSLVHGLFPTIEEAQNSIRNLPDAVQAKNPWIRQIRRIHDSLKNSG